MTSETQQYSDREIGHFVVPRLWRNSKSVTFESLDAEFLNFKVYVSRMPGKLQIELGGDGPRVSFSLEEVDRQVEKNVVHDGRTVSVSLEWTDSEDMPDELMELINSTFYEEASFSLRSGIHIVAEILEEHGIDPIGDEGKAVFNAFLDNVDFEMYGDFYRFDHCSKCSESFKPKYTVEYALQVLAENVLCPKCSGEVVEH